MLMNIWVKRSPVSSLPHMLAFCSIPIEPMNSEQMLLRGGGGWRLYLMQDAISREEDDLSSCRVHTQSLSHPLMTRSVPQQTNQTPTWNATHTEGLRLTPFVLLDAKVNSLGLRVSNLMNRLQTFYIYIYIYFKEQLLWRILVFVG